MKFTLFFLLAFVLQVSATVYSQATKFNFDIRNEQVSGVLKQIESTSNFRFFFQREQVDVNRPVDLTASNNSVEEILDELFKDQHITYRVLEDDLVLLLPEVFSNTEMQQITVTGKVTDSQAGEAMPGVHILVKGTTIGTISDSEGNFTLQLTDRNVTLVFSFVGYVVQELPLGGRTTINVTLTPEVLGLEEVVVVGYGTQKKASLTGSVVVVKMPEIKDQAVASGNVIRALDGRLPGVVTSIDGNPNNWASVLIRGRGSLNSSTAPLIIVDGVPTNRGLNELTPNDIESIQVLKDASAATIYGSRAANGVYIVTTKSAAKGTKIEINSSFTAGFLPSNPIPLMNTEEHGRAQWMAARNDKMDPNYGVYSFQDHQDTQGNWVLDKIILPEYLDAEKTMKPADTDWQEVISRTALSQNHNLIFSNGGEYGSALLSFDYLQSVGTTKYNSWNKLSLRLNSDYKLFNGRIKIGENIALIKMNYTGGSWLANCVNIQSIVPVHTVDGIGWGGPVRGMSDRNNVLCDIMRNRQNYSNDLRLVGSTFADFEIIKNLHFKTTFGVDYDGYWSPSSTLKYVAGYMQETVTKLTTSSGYGGSWTWNNVLNYAFKYADNNINIMVGQEATKAGGSSLWGARDGFASEDSDYLFLDVGESNVRNGGLAWANSQNSYFGRLNYDYKNRYLLTAIMRRDGSSRFGANNRYAFFPSVSAGWVISEESFMKSIPWITNLKLRYGWGKTGNQEIDNYASYTQYQAHYGDDNWPFNEGTAYDIYGADQGNLPSGYYRLQLGNSDLKWETTAQSDFGLDFILLDSKLSGSFDYYLKTTSDILVKPPTLRVTGARAGRWINGAEMKNRGFEFILTYANKINDLGYMVSLNGSHNRNEFTYIVPEAVGAYPGNGRDKLILGRPLNSLYGYVVEGIFQNQADVDAAAVQPGKGVGRLKYKDVNKDGKIDADDRDWIGVNEPTFSWGLNAQATWKGFDFSMLWNSEIGRDISSATKSYTHFFGFFGGQNYGTAVLNCWSPTNTSSTIPAITAADINTENRFSTYYVERTNYLKLQSLSLGYNLPESISKKIYMQKARIFTECGNLWMIKLPGNNFTGFDEKSPAVNYPLPTSVTFGINVIF